jgi:hypothetical protein
MRKMLALVTLLGVAGVGRAGDKEIVKRLEAAGVLVQPHDSKGGLLVSLEAHNLDAALAELCELRGLRWVFLYHPGLTDNQLQQVCALPGLRALSFNDCPITDARLKIVAKVRGLERLSLADTAITDDGLAELTRLRDLISLTLQSTSVTDAGLRHLEGMRGLVCLDLRACPKVTDAGVARLQKALPKCEIVLTSPLPPPSPPAPPPAPPRGGGRPPGPARAAPPGRFSRLA